MQLGKIAADSGKSRTAVSLTAVLARNSSSPQILEICRTWRRTCILAKLRLAIKPQLLDYNIILNFPRVSCLISTEWCEILCYYAIFVFALVFLIVCALVGGRGCSYSIGEAIWSWFEFRVCDSQTNFTLCDAISVAYSVALYLTSFRSKFFWLVSTLGYWLMGDFASWMRH